MEALWTFPRDELIYRFFLHRSMSDNPQVAAYFHEIHRADDRHRVIDEPIRLLLIADHGTFALLKKPYDVELIRDRQRWITRRLRTDNACYIGSPTAIPG
ncbi:hypothetical protein ACQPYK_09895 [Streptosporangium sp. CA-135522]|uniref:hypothetical protein n=1 Tax=Streptosporangium sp. CA-135522 TaxID=3240072 RepID=UPI003D945C1D